MRGFFSFFAILSIVLTAFYIASAGENNRNTHRDSVSALILADSMHYEKQNVKSLFWNAAAAGQLAVVKDGLDRRNTSSNFAGGAGAPRIAGKCPFFTDKKCILITNCEGNYCDPELEGFKAIIRKPFAKTDFTASAGEYIIMD